MDFNLTLRQLLERILVRLPGAKLGDFLMTTPALAGIRAAHPAAKITLLLWPPKPGPWLEKHPLVDDTIWDDTAHTYAGPVGAWRLLERMRAGRFDAVVCLHGGSRYAWLYRLANIPLRYGSSGKYYRRFYTENVCVNRGQPDRHEVEYNFDMVRRIGATGAPGPMVYPVTAADEAAAEKLLAERGWAGEPLLIVNPTFGGSSRLWPAECFIASTQQILAKTGVRVALTGTPGDQESNARIAADLGPKTLDLTGETDVGALAAILKRSALHLSVDTGTSHLAAAMGTPCVTVFPASEHWDQRLRWSPWKTESRTIGPMVRCASCRPGACNKSQQACIDSISPEAVASVAVELFRASRKS